MEINYTNSREDIISFHMQHCTKTKNYRMLRNKFLMCIIVTTLCLLMIAKILNTRTYTTIIIPLIIADLTVILFMKKYLNFIFNKILNKVYNSEKTNSYFNRTKLTISEDYLNLFTDLDRKSYKWKSIHDICLIDNHIFITTPYDNILIPSSCFNSSEEMNFFLTTILKSTNLELKMSYPTDIRYR